MGDPLSLATRPGMSRWHHLRVLGYEGVMFTVCGKEIAVTEISMAPSSSPKVLPCRRCEELLAQRP